MRQPAPSAPNSQTLAPVLSRLLPVCAAATALAALTGCSASFAPAVSSASPAFVINGSAFGGNQPISNSNVYLYAASTTSHRGTSRSMLSTPSGFVTSDANGNFTITGTYTCQPGDQVYLLALGGNPGLAPGTNNPAIALESVLGPCSGLSASTQVNINEVTTVASAFAINGFQASAGNVGSNATTQAKLGLANAFTMAGQLYDLGSGTAVATNTAGTIQVPQAEINTLADILATCVNSDGTGSPCANLFTATTHTGSPAPANTLDAIISVANFPANNVAQIFALAPASAPFQPTLSAAPNDWSVAVNIGPGTLNGAQGVAIDASGNAWFTLQNTNQIAEVVAANPAATPTLFTGGGLSNPAGIAIDDSSNIWVANNGNSFASPAVASSVSEFSSAGVPMSGPTGYTGPTITNIAAIALDGTGSAWVSGSNGGFAKLNSSGTVVSGGPGFFAGSSSGYRALAIDSANNLWAAQGSVSAGLDEVSPSGNLLLGNLPVNGSGFGAALDHSNNAWVAGANALTEYSAAGTLLSPSAGFTGGGYANPSGLAIDGAGLPFVLNTATSNPTTSNPNHNLAQFNASGTALSGTSGYMSGFLQFPNALAVDPSGYVWVADGGAGAVVYLGVATPAVTPLATGVKNNTLATIP